VAVTGAGSGGVARPRDGWGDRDREGAGVSLFDAAITATVIVCGIGLFVFASGLILNAFMPAFGDGGVYQAVLGVGIITALLAALIFAVARYEEGGPCLNYTISSSYNPATKTVMPYRVCTDRGEWIEGSQ
jgi:hypothetical protein